MEQRTHKNNRCHKLTAKNSVRYETIPLAVKNWSSSLEITVMTNYTKPTKIGLVH